MKLSNIIKLLSVLLCIFALFVACDQVEETTTTVATTTEQTTTETETEEPTRGEVAPNLENFFTFSETDSWIELGDAKRIDGTCFSKAYDNSLIVLRSAKVDVNNTVTETFTVYNTVLEQTVLTLTNSYDYDKYTAFDWNDLYVYDESVKYPASVMKVEVVNYDYFGNSYLLKVSRAAVTPIAEDVLEENENACYYSISVNCEFYDVAGNKITETAADANASYDYSYSKGNLNCVVIGDTRAFIDKESGTLVKTVNADNETFVVGYSDETEKYGYFFGTHYSALSNQVKFIEVYKKSTGKIIYSNYFDPAANISFFVLENGNVWVQTTNYFAEDSTLPYDYDIDGVKYTVDHAIINVRTGKITPVEANFVINELEKVTSYKTADLEAKGIKVTDNVDNIATISYIKDQKLDYAQVAVIDNKGAVLFDLARIVPEHKVNVNDFGFEIIDNGNYLVDLYDIVTDRAIVSKDGVVRSYLIPSDVVIGQYVVSDEGIFDFDMNLLYDFEENELKFEAVVGNSIVVSKIIEVFDEVETDADNNNNIFVPEEEIPEETGDETGTDVETGYEEEETTAEPIPDEVYDEYYLITVTDEGYAFELFYDADDRMVLVANQTTEDYIIYRNTETGKYSLFNANLKHVLTTYYEMNIYVCDDNYIVSTSVPTENGDVRVFYTIPKATAESAE